MVATKRQRGISPGDAIDFLAYKFLPSGVSMDVAGKREVYVGLSDEKQYVCLEGTCNTFGSIIGGADKRIKLDFVLSRLQSAGVVAT